MDLANLTDNQQRLMKWIAIDFVPDRNALEAGKIRICRVPNGTRVRWHNAYRATDDELEWFVGEVKVGVTGPGEGVMVEMDHLKDKPRKRIEVNPHKVVEVLWSN